MVTGPEIPGLTKPLVAALILLSLPVIGQTSGDSANAVNPGSAALWAIIPAGGQIYNGKILKAGVILGLEALSIYFWQENAKNYREYDQLSGGLDLPRHRYLEKRNKYAWWVAIVYFYAMLDAVVDAHLINFRTVMEEQIESNELPLNQNKNKDG